MFQKLRLREVWGDVFRSQSQRYASESDIQTLVRFALEDVKAVASKLLPELKLDLFNELSVFQLRADIWVVTAAGVPVGVVKVKKPPLGDADPAAALNNMLVAGEMYDYLLRLKSFHGLRHCFGIATNYLCWRVFWLPSDETDEIAAANQVRLCAHKVMNSILGTFFLRFSMVACSSNVVVPDQIIIGV